MGNQHPKSKTQASEPALPSAWDTSAPRSLLATCSALRPFSGKLALAPPSTHRPAVPTCPSAPAVGHQLGARPKGPPEQQAQPIPSEEQPRLGFGASPETVLRPLGGLGSGTVPLLAPRNVPVDLSDWRPEARGC